MLDLWLIRHAESLGNVDGSEGDSDLSPRGRIQAESLRGAFSSVRFDLAVSSPLLRARSTARIALPNAAVSVDARLAELEPGPAHRFVDASDRSQLLALARAAPAPTESGRSFVERVCSWVDALPESSCVLAFTHFAVVREVLARFSGFARAPQEINHTAIFRLQVTGDEVKTMSWNDLSHLTG